MSKMRAAAQKAIELDPLLAEAHDGMGMAYARDAQWTESEKSFRHAITLDPGRSETHEHFAAFLLWPLNRTEKLWSSCVWRKQRIRCPPEFGPARATS